MVRWRLQFPYGSSSHRSTLHFHCLHNRTLGNIVVQPRVRHKNGMGNHSTTVLLHNFLGQIIVFIKWKIDFYHNFSQLPEIHKWKLEYKIYNNYRPQEVIIQFTHEYLLPLQLNIFDDLLKYFFFKSIFSNHYKYFWQSLERLFNCSIYFGSMTISCNFCQNIFYNLVQKNL